MSAVISLSEHARARRRDRKVSDGDLARADGRARLVFARRDGETRLADLGQRSPCRILLPRERFDEPSATLINTAGGLCGGDRLATEIVLGEGAAATVTSQAAEKIYRALDRDGRVLTKLRLGPAARLHWAPQETILFDSARLRRRTQVDLAADSRLLAAETLVFGRAAMGEVLQDLHLNDRWQVSIGGRLAWSDALRIDDARALSAPAGLNGATAYAALVIRLPDEEAEACRDRLRALWTGGAPQAGASRVAGLVLGRLLGEPMAVRQAVIAALCDLRPRVLRFAAALPRAWSC